MSSVTGIVGQITGAPPAPPVVTPAAASATTSIASKAAPTAGIATRLVSDPLAGVLITQYVRHDDQVVLQTPASTVVAYLQNGLTATGFPKHSAVA